MPVPGTMTSVSWERLQNPALVFGIPVIGYRTAEGKYLENSQLEPDITVANTPEMVVCGRDEQLERAVKILIGMNPKSIISHMRTSGIPMSAEYST